MSANAFFLGCVFGLALFIIFRLALRLKAELDKPDWIAKMWPNLPPDAQAKIEKWVLEESQKADDEQLVDRIMKLHPDQRAVLRGVVQNILDEQEAEKSNGKS